MKKAINLVIMLFCIVGFSQQKSTGIVTLTTGMTVNLTLDNLTSKVTIEITGPSDRWFGLHLGRFLLNEGMKGGEDLVYANEKSLIDAHFFGGHVDPIVDVTNDWVVLSDIFNGNIRTITAQRSFLGDGVDDFGFNFSDTNVDFAWAFGTGDTPAFQMGNHGESNWGYALSNYYNTLGIKDTTLNATEIYPNPSDGKFIVKTKASLQKISIYSQIGILIKNITVDNNNASEIEVKGLQSGVYLIELQNGKEKNWKKVIIN